MNNVSTDDSMDYVDLIDSIDPIDLIDLVEKDNLIDPQDVSKICLDVESDRLKRRSNGFMANKVFKEN